MAQIIVIEDEMKMMQATATFNIHFKTITFVQFDDIPEI
jgi:hypothetical protein